MKLVFTEKDHSKVKKPDFDANFGKFGNALIISLHEDGSIFGCQVVHSAHKKQGFSSIGQIRTNNFQYEDGKVEGELLTDKELEFFGDTWEVNLKFVAPLGEIPKEFQVPEKKKPDEKTATTPKSPASDDDDDDGRGRRRRRETGVKAGGQSTQGQGPGDHERRDGRRVQGDG